MKRLLCYMKGYGRESVLGPLFKLLEASFELLVPLVMAAIIDTGVANGDRGYILRMGGVLLLLGFVGLAASITAQYFSAKAAVGFAGRLRHALFEKVESLSFSQLDALGASTVITRMTSDINQVQTGVNLALRLLLRSPFIVFGAMVMAFTVDAKSALVFVGVIPLLALVVFGVMLWTIPQYRRVQAGLDGVLGKTRETLSGARVLREVPFAEFFGGIPALRKKVSERAILRAFHFFEENERVDAAAAALSAGNTAAFLDAVNKSGESSLNCLQNCFVPGSAEQPVSLAIHMSERLIKDGAVRVHGGGFAGTILAYLAEGEAEGYKAEMAKVFGAENVFGAPVRVHGACRIDPAELI